MQRVGCNGCERTCIISWSRRGRRSCLTHLRAISTFYFSCSFPCHSLLTLYEFNHPPSLRERLKGQCHFGGDCNSGAFKVTLSILDLPRDFYLCDLSGDREKKR